jgi:tRNA(Ile)-lysidine synthetase-like protein
MDASALQQSVQSLPRGRWAVGVSGGADSVALVRLLVARPDLELHVVHLNHQTRGEDSDEDARFVRNLAAELNLPATVESIDQLLPLPGVQPNNRSALFRAARMALFARIVQEQHCQGVAVAHHRLDQAETVLLRLMRGNGPLALAGMSPLAQVGAVAIARPLLGIWPEALRQWLIERGHPWREDASNQLPISRRNRMRKVLNLDRPLAESLVQLADRCRELKGWVRCNLGDLPVELEMGQWDGLPPLLRGQAGRQWLGRAGVPKDQITPAMVDRLLLMLDDRASAGKWDFAAGVRVDRNKNRIKLVDKIGHAGQSPPNHF